ncbi:hypothetical protein I551_2152 [Mycobacterium ulcerans str. Harvey]|uniref:Uncharacterized protein n=1 Tax=Mycobacterium ulcerans str. Harvey TaxID=1299332 RepID=A0ABP3AK77_MYCUL|nr:hypothetical protein I551_2152 [Mycobacterium ulcerans str. Harvey]
MLIRRCAPLVAKKVSGDDGRRCLGGKLRWVAFRWFAVG